MYIGYFTPFSKGTFIQYLASIFIFGFFYIFIYGINIPPEYTIYTWLLMLLIFPKEGFPPTYMGTLVNIGFGVKDMTISMYEILDIFIVMAMIIAIIRYKSIRTNQLLIPKNVSTLYRFFLIMILVGIISIIRDIISNNIYDDFNVGRIIFDKYPLYGGLYPVIVGAVVFQASVLFIRTQKQVDNILKIMVISSLILGIEFILFKYLGLIKLLPVFLANNAFDYIGGFRSVIQAGSLFVSQLLILGVGASLYFFYKSKHVFYIFTAVFFIYIIIQTYQRVSLLTVGVIIFIVYQNNTHKKSKLLYALMIFILISALSIISSTNANNIINTVTKIFDPSNVKPGGYWGVETTQSRIGLSLRAMDIFLYDPFLGSGPGNIINYMNSPSIPKVMSKYFPTTEKISYDNYQLIANGLRSTNAHNLYIQISCEYGIIGMICISLLIFVVASRYRIFKKQIKNNAYSRSVSVLYINTFAYSLIIGFGVYYIFQAVSLLWGIFFLVLRFTFLDPNDTY